MCASSVWVGVLGMSPPLNVLASNNSCARMLVNSAAAQAGVAASGVCEFIVDIENVMIGSGSPV